MPFASHSSPGKPVPTKTSTYTASPSLTDVTITDDDTSLSNRDEFYLEEFSTKPKESHCSRSRSDRSLSPRKKPRPELNIVTQLPTTQARACDPDVTVEHVGAKKTAAKIRPKSIVSSKAEHFDNSLLIERTRVLATIKNLAQARKDRKQARRGDFELLGDGPPSANDRAREGRKPRSEKRKDSDAVVIGISIPKEQAAIHQSQADFSAVTLDTPTPTTPAIVVTPAEAEYSHDAKSLPPPQLAARGTRPISSVYSTYAFSKNNTGPSEDVPPVPVLPRIPRKSSRRKSIGEVHAQKEDGRISRKSRRFSGGTSGDVDRDDIRSARHKSQGWWNLALSPMLSRAGTTKSQRPRQLNDSPEIPPIPDATALQSRTRSGTEGSQISPETPRRLGLAGIRASIWSHWTIEHRGIRATRESVNTTHPERGDLDQDDDLSDLDTQEPLPRDLPFQDAMAQFQPRVVGGLADEYYHACAIEQLSGQQYFECENHSCVEAWPQFKSVFDSADDGDLAARTSSTGPAEDGRRAGIGAIATAGAADAVAGAAVTAAALHHRTASGDSESVIISPNVRQADTGSVVQARSVEHKTPPLEQKTSESNPSTGLSTPPAMLTTASLRAAPTPTVDVPPSAGPRSIVAPEQRTKYSNIAAIMPPPASVDTSARIVSPGPVSPEMQRAMASPGAVPMTEMRATDQQTHAGPRVFHNYYGHMPPQETKEPSLALTNNVKESVVASQKILEGDKLKKPGMVQRIKAWAAARKAAKASHSTEKKKSKKSRCMVSLIFIGLLMMICGSLLLALLLTRSGDETPTSTQWLNLTGYPPMPTGISTIIRPDVVNQQSQCVQPNTAWSCSLPPEEQDEISPNNPDQPNFRFEIKFRNGTVASNLTIPIDNSGLRKRASDPFTNALFMPNPPPPPRAEQIFLGNTTDNVTIPFDGEDTPFYMSFVPAFPIDPSDIKLNSTSGSNTTTSQFALRQESSADSLLDLIPSPSIDGSGLAAPANLLPESPLPFSQPIRFYNRGLPDEHFGFYMYYDRSIFLTTSVTPNATSSSNESVVVTPDNPDTTADGALSDANGGAPRSSARSRCTFSQTRFLVQIFTNPAFDGALTGPVPKVGSKEAGNSAVNYTPPGSFPYPATITLDRHGGNVNKKAAYCYAVDDDGRIIDDQKGFLLERRGFGGTAVNPAPQLLLSPEESGDDGGFDQDAGGIDGGTGGCKCAWQNWS